MNFLKTLVITLCFSLVLPQFVRAQEESAMADDEQSAEEEEAPKRKQDSKVTLDFRNAEIKNVLRILSLKSGVNIVAGPEVQGLVTIRLVEVPWEKALEVVLRTYGYVYEREGNVIRVTTRERVSQEDLATEAFVLNYITAQEVQEAVQEMLSERGRLKSVNRTNTLIVTDVSANIYKIKQVIERLDMPTPQAYIDSRIVRTELGEAENLGIQWGVGLTATGSSRPTTFPFASPSIGEATPHLLPGALQNFFPSTAAALIPNPVDSREFPIPAAADNAPAFSFGSLDATAMQAVFAMLQSRNNTKIVSNPRIVVLNNQTAKVQVGQQIGIPSFERNESTGSFEVTGYEMRDVGVVLNVTPHINDENEILVDLQPEVSSFDGYNVIGTTNLSAPQFTITQALTQVLIASGETIAIGGLLTDSSTATYTKVPFLGDIPFIGKAFRSKRETSGQGNRKVETLFFVTVDVVDTEGQPTAGGEIYSY